ncbi:hypothetical protein L208DRAFT_1548274 [Tricholoma matsutake]|nr:hypothetical protein L208DRAFT_1548274 [Tricholoma matsutake 945]
MVELTTLLSDVQLQPDAFQGITLAHLMDFVVYAGKFKDNILLVQTAEHLLSVPPPILPQSVAIFLRKACGIVSSEQIDHCWDLLKDMIWDQEPVISVEKEALHTLYLPQHTCVKADCTWNKQKFVLKKAEQHQAVLFMMDGVFPTWSVHLYCTNCNINYHHNFYIEAGQHMYYDTILDIIQVGEHQFVEQRVIDMFITLMLVSWTSATNCAQLYNLTLSKDIKLCLIGHLILSSHQIMYMMDLSFFLSWRTMSDITIPSRSLILACKRIVSGMP